MKNQKKQTVVVMGLGYVGLPLAIRVKEKNFNVIGIDLCKEKVDLINKKISPIEDQYLIDNLPKNPILATTDQGKIKEADIVLICVPTPVDKYHNPDITFVENACEVIAKNIKPNVLVVLESTVNPGVSEEIVKPIFEKYGFKIGIDVFIAHCPERINPGDPKWNVTNISRVVGAFTKKGLKKAVDFYKEIVDGEVKAMTTIKEAEACKIIENSFRDINLAFVNELAKSFDVLGINIKNVIEGASTKPFAFIPHYPSCGIGGHCIPVDPYYLIEQAKKVGFDHKFLRLSRDINNSMPKYTIKLLQNKLNEIKMPINGTNIGILGISYKANIDDDRESPYYEIKKELIKYRANIVSFDPYIENKSDVPSMDDLLKFSDAIIIITNHKQFLSIDGKLLKEYNVKIVIDGKNCLDKENIESNNILYKGIGC